MGSLPDERHTDTELERPELLSSERLAAIVAECLRRWDAYPTIPGSLRWSRNGLLALHQLETTIERQRQEIADLTVSLAAALSEGDSTPKKHDQECENNTLRVIQAGGIHAVCICYEGDSK